MRLEYQVVANCRPEHVWQVFADMDRWSQWNPVVSKSHWISGQPWAVGSRFFMDLMQPRRMSFKPVMDEISSPNRVVWTGTAPGFKGTHGHEFTAQPDGTTLIRTWEDLSGFATYFFSSRMKQSLIQMYAAWLNSLKAEAERLTRAPATELK